MKAIYVNQYEVKKLGKYVEYQGRIYTNPEIAYPEIVEALGYKELEITERPGYNENTQYLIPIYSIEGDKIIESFDVKDLEIPESSRIEQLKQNLADTDYKAIKYLEGYLTDEEYDGTRILRKQWREEIKRLENENNKHIGG